MSADTMTVLFSVSRMYATKRIGMHRKTRKIIKTPYGRETHFQVKQIALGGFEHMCQCLDILAQRPFAFVIRGAPLPGTTLEKTRRLVHDDPETGEAATFTAAPRHWFAIDIDKIRRPVAIDPVTDPEAAVEHLIGLLPPELHDASCWWQFTCSQSLRGHEDTLSARLWFWAFEPLDDASLTRWANNVNKGFGGRLIDPSIYRAVQPHYIADPIFEYVRDPLPRRHGIRVGLDKAVSLLIPEPSVDDPYVGGEGYVGLGIEGHIAEIGGERGFRGPMVSAIAAYFAANGADASPEPIKHRVREAIIRAPLGGRAETEIARYCADRHLNDIIGWVRARERSQQRSDAPRQSPVEFLEALATAVPVGTERVKATRVITQHLLRQKYLNPQLAVSLVESWNQLHCAPPLPNEQVRAIAAAIATHEIAAVQRHRDV
jgi:hypothetical protein